MGAGSRARGVRMRAGDRPGGAGLRGEGAAAVVEVSLASWRGRCVVARAVVGKAPGVACVGPARPRDPRGADPGSRRCPVPRRTSGRSRGRAPPGRPGCARVARATRAARSRFFPARRRVDARPRLGRPRFSSPDRGLRGRACKGEARPGSGEARAVSAARLLSSREGGSGFRRPVWKAGGPWTCFLGWEGGRSLN